MAKQPKTPVLFWTDHPDLIALQRLGDQLRAKREELEHVGVPARQALDAAQSAYDEAELRFWADKATKAELQAAQKTLEDAKRANARNALELRAVTQDLARVEQDLPAVMIAAREEVARQIADIGEALLARFIASLEQAASDWRSIEQLEQIAREGYRGTAIDDAFPLAVGIPSQQLGAFHPVFTSGGLVDQLKPAASAFSRDKVSNTTWHEVEVWQPPDAASAAAVYAPTPAQFEPWLSPSLVEQAQGLLGLREQLAIDERMRNSK